MRFRTVILAIAAAAFSAVASAQDTAQQQTQEGVPVVAADGSTLAEIITWPTEEQIFNAWPAAARRVGLEGSASLRCVIDRDGRARDCTVLSESQRGMGFGRAALDLSLLLRAEPGRDRDGNPVPFSIPLSFDFKCGDLCERLDTNALRLPLAVRVAWASAPTLWDVKDAYPPAAWEQGVSGEVVLDCTLQSNGTLSRCRVDSEAPTGYGFATAAMQLAAGFRGPENQSGAARLLLPITFKREGDLVASGVPDLVSGVTSEEFQSAFPQAARDAGTDRGEVLLVCVIGPDGQLAQCQAAAEAPTGLGFARAALTLAPRFQMNLWSADGLPTVGAAVRAPFEFELPKAPIVDHVRVLEYPEWDRRPNAEEVSNFYPDRALRMEMEGTAMLDCMVQPDGALADCSVTAERPRNYQFGEAALQLSKIFRLRPLSVDGRAVMPSGARVNIPIQFQLR